MKQKFISWITVIVIVLLLTSGLIKPIVKFFVWLFTLNMTQSTVSKAGEIFVKVSTFIISFAVVRIVFNTIGRFDRTAMKIAYYIVSTLVWFALCWLVMIFETHLLLISIIVGILFVIVAALFIILSIRSKKEEMKTEV